MARRRVAVAVSNEGLDDDQKRRLRLLWMARDQEALDAFLSGCPGILAASAMFECMFGRWERAEPLIERLLGSQA